MTPTHGQTLLRSAIADQRLAVARLARQLGVSRVTLHSYLSGRYRPAPTMRAIIEAVLGIPEASWESDDERARREHVVALSEARARAQQPDAVP